jgi:hypothetical protein
MAKQILHITAASILSLALAACGIANRIAINNAISDYHAQADKVQLGDPKDKVLSILLPTQEGLQESAKKPRESFMNDKSVIEIYFMRSGLQPDGLTTDDEFTPYIFKDGVLAAIGWTFLGGPKTTGQAVRNTVIQQPPHTNFTCYRNGPFLNCQ